MVVDAGMTSADILDSGMSVHFNRKLLFSAEKRFISTRGQTLFLPKTPVSHTDVWKIKPPDFSPKLYQTLSFPRVTKSTLDPVKLKTGLEEVSQTVRMPVMSSKPEKKSREPEFITSHKPPGLLDLQLLFVKSGTFPRSPYKNPKPHNFRPCAEHLPDMVTITEKDPGNLNFKIRYLEPITETHFETNLPSREETIINTFKPAELKWDPKLILPKSPYPPKSASYTRHRRRRTVHSAFMDRVEEKFTRSWMK